MSKSAKSRLAEKFAGGKKETAADSFYFGMQIPNEYRKQIEEYCGIETTVNSNLFACFFFEHTELGKKIKADIIASVPEGLTV